MRHTLAACLLAFTCLAAHAETTSMDTRLLYAAQRGDAPAIRRLLRNRWRSTAAMAKGARPCWRRPTATISTRPKC